jgi:hypothetical protein
MLGDAPIDAEPKRHRPAEKLTEAHPRVVTELPRPLALVDATDVDGGRGIDQPDIEPPLDLAAAGVRPSHLRLELVRQPLRMFTKQLHLIPTQAGPLAELAASSVDGLLPHLETTLRQLPTPGTALALQREHPAVG